MSTQDQNKSKCHYFNCKHGISVCLYVLLNYLIKYALLPPQHPGGQSTELSRAEQEARKF